MIQKEALNIESYVIQCLKQERIAKNISYGEIARRTGLHRTAISLIEKGKRHPTLLVCIKISQALDIDLSHLIKQANTQ